MSEYMSDRVSDRVSEYILGVCQNLCQIDCHMECQIPNVRTYVRYNIGWRGSKKVIGLDVYLKQSNNSAEKRFAKSSIWGANHLDKPKSHGFSHAARTFFPGFSMLNHFLCKSLGWELHIGWIRVQEDYFENLFHVPFFGVVMPLLYYIGIGMMEDLAALPDQLLGCQKPFILDEQKPLANLGF